MHFLQKMKEESGKLVITFLIMLLVLVFLSEQIFVTIRPGHGGVLFRLLFNKGTVLDRVYGEGLNMVLPWDTMYVYDLRIQEKEHEVSVLSQNGLTVQVTVSMRYHIAKKELPILHQRVGENYVDKIIIPSIISSVREVVGEYRPEEIYTTARHLIQDKLLIEMVEETGRIPIIYDDIIVENIALPALINAAIEQKLKQEQEYLEYEFRLKKADQEIARKEKDATGINKYQKIVTESISPELLKWKGIMATLELAQSPNTKVIIVGGGKDGLPIIFNADSSANPPSLGDTLNKSKK